MSSVNFPERWVSLEEAAEIAGVHPKTVTRAIHKGALRRAKNGVRRVLIAYSDLVRWMKGGK
jgi:excisionase family DNA binding protein